MARASQESTAWPHDDAADQEQIRARNRALARIACEHDVSAPAASRLISAKPTPGFMRVQIAQRRAGTAASHLNASSTGSLCGDGRRSSARAAFRQVVDRIDRDDDEDDDEAGFLQLVGAQAIRQQKPDAARADDPRIEAERTLCSNM